MYIQNDTIKVIINEIIMKTSIKKWGNSLAFRIPKSIAQDLSLKDGTEVKIVVKEDRLVIIPDTNFTIDDFMVGLSPETRHDPIEIEPLGKEFI